MRKQECIVHIPGINESRRFLVPDNMQLQNCILLMVELIKDEYAEVQCREEDLNLFKASTGEILDKRKTLAEIDVMEHDELILG